MSLFFFPYRHLLRLLLPVLAAILAPLAWAEEAAPEKAPQQGRGYLTRLDPSKHDDPLRWGLAAEQSLRGWVRSDKAAELARRLFADEPFSVFRIPIYATRPVDDPIHREVAKLARLVREANPQVTVWACLAASEGASNGSLEGMEKFAASLLVEDNRGQGQGKGIQALDIGEYAAYLDAYIELMEAEGVSIDWISPFNEDEVSASQFEALFENMQRDEGLKRFGGESRTLAAGLSLAPSLSSTMQGFATHLRESDKELRAYSSQSRQVWRELHQAATVPLWLTEAPIYRGKEKEFGPILRTLDRLILAANGGVEGIALHRAVPRIVDFQNQAIPFTSEALGNFISQTSANRRVFSSRIGQAKVAALAHVDASGGRLGVHFINSLTRPASIRVELPSEFSFAEPASLRIWNKDRTDAAEPADCKRQRALLTIPAGSYAFLDAGILQAPAH